MNFLDSTRTDSQHQEHYAKPYLNAQPDRAGFFARFVLTGVPGKPRTIRSRAKFVLKLVGNREDQWNQSNCNNPLKTAYSHE